MRRASVALLLLLSFADASARALTPIAMDFDRSAPSLFSVMEAVRAQVAAMTVAGIPAVIPLIVFPSAPLDILDWMSAEGWQSKRDDPRGWEVGGGALHFLSNADSVLLATERGFPRDISLTPILRLRLKVRAVPRGTDLARKSGDDAALRVFIAFERGGGLFSPPRTIGYNWTEKDDAGTLIASAYFSNVQYISLGKGITPGDEWVVVERDLAADYRRAFPADAEVPPLRGLALKCDANDTKTSAEAWLSEVGLRAK